MTEPADAPPRRDGRRTSAAARRRERGREILAATRVLFDERGTRDAQIEDIARAVGINRAIIYRHFSGKEELFSMVLVGYLDELRAGIDAVVHPEAEPIDQVRAMAEAFWDYGYAHPAFADCAQALMRRTGPELLDEVSEDVMLRLGRAITGCLGPFAAVLRDGNARGVFDVPDPDLLANMLYAQGLGVLSLARVGLQVREGEAGAPEVEMLSGDRLRDYLVDGTVGLVRSARAVAD
ncbi:MAG: TetR family transcriptional regulator [Propionibacteriales bacterium]|nr:TetR family transcriptional regulator [Propionibacteriales bacterium]